MEISLTDFNALTAEMSRRDVKIARLEMEMEANRKKHCEELQTMQQERNELWAENDSLKQKICDMNTAYENLRFENHWMKQYILLSVERVREFFSHIRDFTLLSAIKSFVLDVLPPNATPEQRAFTQDVMRLKMPEDAPQSITMQNPHFNGPMYDVHGNNEVNLDN